MLLLEGIQFLFQGFLFLDISRSSCVRFRLFIAWNIHTVVFLPISVLCCCYVCSYVVSAVHGRYNKSFIALFNAVFVLVNTILNAGASSSSFLIHIVCIWYLSNMKPCASSWTFFSSGLSSSIIHLKSGLEYLTRGTAKCLSLWWDFCGRSWFQEVFLCFFKYCFIFFFYLRLFNGVCF